MYRISFSSIALIALMTVFALPGCGTDPAPRDHGSATQAPPPAATNPEPSRFASPRLLCSAEIAIECPAGYEDGCAGGRTTHIACVRKGAKAIAPCTTEVFTPCAADEINACDAKPPFGTMHVCVHAPRVPAASKPDPSAFDEKRIPCSAEIDIACPAGYEDGCGGGRTTHTVCVRKGAKAVAPCSAQIYTACAADEINACFAKPPFGEKHICVRAPRKQAAADPDDPDQYGIDNDEWEARAKFEDEWEALETLCAAPTKLPATATSSNLGKYVAEKITHEPTKALFASLGAMKPADRVAALRTKLSRFQIKTCPFLDAIEGGRWTDR